MTFTYRGYLGQRTGYAMASMMDVLALERAGADFACASLSPRFYVKGLFGPADEAVARHLDPTCWDREGVQIIRSIPTDALAPMPSARSDQGFPASYRIGTKLICATVFEVPKWPIGWVGASNLYDALIVPNGWLADAAKAAGVTTPIHVVPHALEVPSVAREVAMPEGECWWERPTGNEPIRVLTEGTYMLRKNIPAAAEAFWRAFERDEAVLFIHTSFFQPEHRAMLMRELWERRVAIGKSYGDLAPIVISSAQFDWRGLWHMYDWAARGARGIYLSMAYAEGVGYPLLQAAARGLSIVCTKCEGHLSTLEDIEGVSFVSSTPTCPGKLRPFDPMDATFRIAHIHDEDPWWRPDPMDAAHLMKQLGPHKPSVNLDPKTIMVRHDPKTVGAALMKVVAEVA